MKEGLLEILACPKCKGPLKLEVSKREGGEIAEGKLLCTPCGLAFEIMDSIPRLLLEG